jgi:peptidyl-prolyl cis-trans isomerase SurA
MLTRRVIGGEVGSKVNIPEADLKKYYDDHQSEFVRKSEVYMSQILISTEGKNPEQVANAEKKAKELVARANKGEKFSELASENSDDTATAHEGGALPAIQPDQLRDDLKQIVAKTRKGQVTDPIKTPQGFLILKVNDRFDEGLAPFDEVKDRIHEFLAEPKMQPKLQEYLNRLRQEAYLEIKDGYVDTAAAPGKDTRWHEVAEIKAQTVTKREVMATRTRKKAFFLIPAGKKPTRPVLDSDASAGDAKTGSQAAASASAKAPKTKVKKTKLDKIRAKAAKAEKAKATKEAKVQKAKAKADKPKEQKAPGKKTKTKAAPAKKVEKDESARPTHGRIKPSKNKPADSTPDETKPAETNPVPAGSGKPAFDKPNSGNDKPAADTPALAPAPVKP